MKHNFKLLRNLFVFSILLALPYSVKAQDAAPEQPEVKPAIVISSDRTIIWVDRLELTGEESLMDVFQMYGELLISRFDPALLSGTGHDYRLRMENVDMTVDIRQFLTNTKASQVRRVQICENAAVAKGTGGFRGVIDVNMKKNEEGLHGYVGTEMTTDGEPHPFANVRYGNETTDYHANISVDDISRKGNYSFTNYGDVLVSHKFDAKNKINVYGRHKVSANDAGAINRFYRGRVNYWHNFEKGSLLLLGVYSHTDNGGGGRNRSVTKSQMYVAEYEVPLAKGLDMTVGWEGGFDKNEVEMNAGIDNEYWDNYNDFYLQFNYTVGPVKLTLGDRAQLHSYAVTPWYNKDKDLKNNRWRNFWTASAVFNFAKLNYLHLAYYRRFSNPNALGSIGGYMTGTNADGEYIIGNDKLKEQKGDIARLAYSFSNRNLTVHFGSKFIHFHESAGNGITNLATSVDVPYKYDNQTGTWTAVKTWDMNGKESNTFCTDLSVTWRKNWFAIVAGGNLNWAKADEAGAKATKYGYARVNPSFYLPKQWNIGAQLIYCSKNTPEKGLYADKDDKYYLYGLLTLEKTFGEHVGLRAQWRDPFSKDFSAGVF